MTTKKEVTLKEFYDDLTLLKNEVMDSEGKVQSHNIIARISVYEDDFNCTSYDIVNLELDHLFGCGCPSGISIIIKKIEDE